jgi:hypothetical protein
VLHEGTAGGSGKTQTAVIEGTAGGKTQTAVIARAMRRAIPWCTGGFRERLHVTVARRDDVCSPVGACFAAGRFKQAIDDASFDWHRFPCIHFAVLARLLVRTAD